MDELLLILFGLGGGFLSGLLGVGGGIIFILVLPSVLLGVGVCEQQLVAYTISNSMFAIFIASFSANIKSIIQHRFMYKEVFSIGFLNVIFGILGMKYIVSSEWYSKDLFNIIISVILGVMLYGMLRSSKNENRIEKETSKAKLSITGAAAGFISALSGLGGGVVIVPFLKNFFNMDIKKAKTISLGVIGLMAFCLTIFNLLTDPICISSEFQIGMIIFPITLTISLGVLIGAPLGVKVSHLISSKSIQLIFSVILGIVILKKIYELYISFFLS